MNPRTIGIILCTGLYSALFYHQSAGINFLVFTLILIGVWGVTVPNLFKSQPTILLLIGAVFSSVFVALYGASLAIAGVILCLSLVPVYHTGPLRHVLVNMFYGIYSTGGMLVFQVMDAINRRKSGKKGRWITFVLVILPILILFVFFLLYRSSNPLVEKFTENWSFDFITAEWIFFTLGGLWLMLAVYHPRNIKGLDSWQARFTNEIFISHDQPKSKWNLEQSFLILFVGLNVMLLVINGLDINYLYMGAGMPEGVDHKQFVHNGVHSLVFSMLLGVVLLAVFLKGQLNFGPKKKKVILLASAWIIQNLFLICSTAIRNGMYIDQALLTYKRIGVFYWLLGSVVVLVLGLIKVRKAKTGAYVLRYAVVAFVGVFVISSAVDWDGLISKFNIRRMRDADNLASYDKRYLLFLSEGNLADLYELRDKSGFLVDSSYSYKSYLQQDNQKLLDEKLFEFLKERYMHDWRSWSYRRSLTQEKLREFHEAGGLKSMAFENQWDMDLHALASFSHLGDLKLVHSGFSENKALKLLEGFGELERLNLTGNNIESLDTLESMAGIHYLDLHDNNIEYPEFLEAFPSLDSLVLSRNKLATLDGFPALPQLKFLDISGNPCSDALSIQAPVLESLIANESRNLGELPYFPMLRALYLSKSFAVLKKNEGLLEKYPNLEILDLAGNDLKSLREVLGVPKSPNLRFLDISSNRVKNLRALAGIRSLEVLKVNGGALKSLMGIDSLLNLKELYIQNTRILHLARLRELKNLKMLDIANVHTIKKYLPLYHMTSLEQFYAPNSNFIQLEMLSQNKGLKVLDVENCKLVDYEKLALLPELEHLTISGIKKKHLPVLKSLKRLKYLELDDVNHKVFDEIKKELRGVKVMYNY